MVSLNKECTEIIKSRTEKKEIIAVKLKANIYLIRIQYFIFFIAYKYINIRKTLQNIV